MCSKSNKCDICWKENDKLIRLGETDSNNVQWSKKLTFCVPEAQWNETCTMCYDCTEQLNISCTFRKQCLQSNALYVQLMRKELNPDNYETTKEISLSESSHNGESHFYSCTVTYLQSQEHTSNDCIAYQNLKKTARSSIEDSIGRINEDQYNREEKIEDVKDDDQSSLVAEEYRSTNDDADGDDSMNNEQEPSFIKKKSKTEKNSSINKRNRFYCEQCNDYFLSSKKLINHSINVHGLDSSLVKPFACDKCESKFSSSSNLQQHKKYHRGDRSHICTFCGKGFITKNDLNIHEKQHLNKREYKCSSCPKTFNTHKDLRTHKLVVHTDSSLWNYICTFCPKRFPIKSNLDQHIRRHKGEKRFACHICEKRFVDKCVLQKHIKSHSNFRAFKCEYCSKEYKENRILEIHKTKIHGVGNAKIPERVKKHFCHICPKSYFAKNKLTRHMFSHTGEKPYVCHICERKFTDKSYVKQHLKTTHNIIDMDENR